MGDPNADMTDDELAALEAAEEAEAEATAVDPEAPAEEAEGGVADDSPEDLSEGLAPVEPGPEGAEYRVRPCGPGKWVCEEFVKAGARRGWSFGDEAEAADFALTMAGADEGEPE